MMPGAVCDTVHGPAHLTPPHHSLSQSAGFHNQRYCKKPTQIVTQLQSEDKTSFSLTAKLFFISNHLIKQISKLSIVNTCSQDNMFSHRLAGEYTCFDLLACR